MAGLDIAASRGLAPAGGRHPGARGHLGAGWPAHRLCQEVEPVHVQCGRNRFAGTGHRAGSSFCAAIFSRRPPLTFHHPGHQPAHVFSVGGFCPTARGLHPVLPDWNKPPQEFGGTWTPDGEYFLFESTRDHTQNIWARREGTSFFRKAGAEPTQLTVGPLLFSNPTPSMDGKKLFVIGQQRRFDLVAPGQQVATVFRLPSRRVGGRG